MTMLYTSKSVDLNLLFAVKLDKLILWSNWNNYWFTGGISQNWQKSNAKKNEPGGISDQCQMCYIYI